MRNLLIFLLFTATLTAQQKATGELSVRLGDQTFAQGALAVQRIIGKLPDSTACQVTFIVGKDKKIICEIITRFELSPKALREIDEDVQAALPSKNAEASWRVNGVIVGKLSELLKVFGK